MIQRVFYANLCDNLLNFVFRSMIVLKLLLLLIVKLLRSITWLSVIQKNCLLWTRCCAPDVRIRCAPHIVAGYTATRSCLSTMGGVTYRRQLHRNAHIVNTSWAEIWYFDPKNKIIRDVLGWLFRISRYFYFLIFNILFLLAYCCVPYSFFWCTPNLFSHRIFFHFRIFCKKKSHVIALKHFLTRIFWCNSVIKKVLAQ